MMEFLVPENNEDAMVDEIKKIIENPELGEKLCLNARKKVESFDWDSVKDKWNSVLN